MKNLDSNNSNGSSGSNTPADAGFSPWQRLKTKRISYLTLPLLVMATVTEFVILATGWKYQQVVCLPQGMGVTFFGIGPIGATILAVELLKLPLAIWTASRMGWQKGFMLVIGLPLICVLTFQLVKDMAVYEMGVAMTPASQLLEKATIEETKINQLNGELTAIEGKKTERQRKLDELAAKEAKAKADLDDSLKRNEDTRRDAISLTDYQKKELADVEARQANMIRQFNADAEQLTKSIADLRSRREAEVSRETRWNVEDARIENEYKAKLSEYTNRKTAYDKDKKEFETASFVKRQLLKEPVDPGVPPVREANMVLKSTLLADLDTQIKSKEAELLAVNNKRRDAVARVETDANQLRQEFDRRSSTKREEADRKREELSAAQTVIVAELKAERKQADQDLVGSVQKVDGIRGELDAARKRAEGFYEAREAAIRVTQVHRIATTVEIVRGLFKGERPTSIKASAKERGDILTDQISMVRIWVYPVLAFIVAFLPTLMVEVGFSTVFKPEQQRPAHRLGFLGRRMHALYMRAGRQKIMRAERLAGDAAAEFAGRSRTLVDAKVAAERALAEREVELRDAREFIAATATANDDRVRMLEGEHANQLYGKEQEWAGKLAALTETLNHSSAEKDGLRDFQQLEIERQVQQRQTVWTERLAEVRKDLESQHVAHEAERAAMSQAHHKKLLEVSEDCKAQLTQVRRQMADSEVAAQETTARLTYKLKEAATARDAAQFQLQQQTEAFSLKFTQVKEESARDLEKIARQEKHRLERQQLEFSKSLQQCNEELEHQLKRREQELSLAFDTRLSQEQSRLEQEAHRRQAEVERQVEGRIHEVDTRWNQELQAREEAAQVRLKQREQQLQAQAEIRLAGAQKQAAQDLRRRESELERQLEAQSRETAARVKQELQKQEVEFQAKLKQREQELAAKTVAHELELQQQWTTDLQAREVEWERQSEARVRSSETRLAGEVQKNEEQLQSKLRQRDQQWQVKLDAARAESKGQTEEAVRRRGLEADAALRDLETRHREEVRHHDEVTQATAKQREQELALQLNGQAEARKMAAQVQWEAQSEIKLRAAVEPLKALLVRTEKERDEARHSATESSRNLENLEKKLTEASLFLTAGRNGKNLTGTT